MLARRPLFLAALSWGLSSHAAAPRGAGRWEGQVDMRGEPMPIVLDLAPDAAGVWRGSVTLPGRRVKGAPLDQLAVDGRGARFRLAAAFLVPSEPPPQMSLRWQGTDRAEGTLAMAGLRCDVALRRSGDAQVDTAPSSTPIADALLGTWTGRYELGGYEREVTLTLSRDAAGLGRAGMVVVGRRRTEVPFALVEQGPRFLSLRGNDFGIAIEGRWSDGAIEAVIEQGPFESALPLRRAVEATR